MVKAIDKGKQGEREVVKLLQPVVDEVYEEFGLTPIRLERNLVQTRNGGYDVIGLDWLALEIKRQETLHVDKWWKQTLSQCGEGQEPVLMYRRNRKPWRIRLWVALGGGLVLPAEIGLEDWKLYMAARLRADLGGGNGAI